MPASDSSPNGGALSGRFAHVPDSGPGGAAAAYRDDVTARAGPAAGRSGDAQIAQPGKLAEIALPAGADAPGAARMVIAHCLTGLVAQRVLHDAELLVSELVTNSLDHGELSASDSVLLRVYLAADTMRLEIENPGTAGVVASSARGRRSRHGGFGLELVNLLAARWGVSRDRSTKVWFEMGRA